MTAKEKNKEIREMQRQANPDSFRVKGKKGKTPDGLKIYKEKAIRRRVNILRYTKQRIEEGYSGEEIRQMLMDNYEITAKTAERYYCRAKELITYSMVWDADTIRNRNIQRLDEIVEETKEDEDYQNAIKAIDVLNKTANVYVEKKEINIDGNEITFTFGTGETK